MVNLPKNANPFVIKSANNDNVILKTKRKHCSSHQGNIITFESNWTKFCRGKLSARSFLTCLNCNFPLVRQIEVLTHTYQWYKGQHQERNQTGFDEDDNDGGLAGTYSRLQIRLDTEPRECNCVFLKKTEEWMKFYLINNVSFHCKLRENRN